MAGDVPGNGLGLEMGIVRLTERPNPRRRWLETKGRMAKRLDERNLCKAVKQESNMSKVRGQHRQSASAGSC